jgi:hypothetical protein
MKSDNNTYRSIVVLVHLAAEVERRKRSLEEATEALDSELIAMSQPARTERNG